MKPPGGFAHWPKPEKGIVSEEFNKTTSGERRHSDRQRRNATA
jgi:hypothetical protein